MNFSYEHQIFISYAREQRSAVEGIVGDLRAAGLNVWWDRDILLGEKWNAELKKAIKSSRHFLLYCTINAKASSWVNNEIKTFRDDSKGDSSRKLFVLKAQGCEPKHVPLHLGSVQNTDHINDVIIAVLKESRDSLDQRLREVEKETDKNLGELRDALNLEKRKVAEARQYYRHRRFWGPFAENQDVHIFTCGRDIPPDDARPRGTGGFRTNIDKWDYRAVLGITHYFASNYPGTKLKIEDPASKLHQEDIVRTNVLANRIAEVGSLLKDKDSIIIGSPDVNDFAEIALSQIHKIDPYDNERKKAKGFVLIRDRKTTASAFYWQTAQSEHEGIARLDPGEVNIHEHRSPRVIAGRSEAGEMHGLLIVADNPFGDLKRKIMILSGFSGVATHALTKFLTEDAYLQSFFEFDEAYSRQARAIEAVISVKYNFGPGSENKDARQIDEAQDSIKFVELVAV